MFLHKGNRYFWLHGLVALLSISATSLLQAQDAASLDVKGARTLTPENKRTGKVHRLILLRVESKGGAPVLRSGPNGNNFQLIVSDQDIRQHQIDFCKVFTSPWPPNNYLLSFTTTYEMIPSSAVGKVVFKYDGCKVDGKQLAISTVLKH